jgi:hypothetical protein
MFSKGCEFAEFAAALCHIAKQQMPFAFYLPL